MTGPVRLVTGEHLDPRSKNTYGWQEALHAPTLPPTVPRSGLALVRPGPIRSSGTDMTAANAHSSRCRSFRRGSCSTSMQCRHDCVRTNGSRARTAPGRGHITIRTGDCRCRGMPGSGDSCSRKRTAHGRLQHALRDPRPEKDNHSHSLHILERAL